MTIPAELSYTDCLRLLRQEEVARVAVCTSEGPHIVPVNYVVVDDMLVFRTTPYSALGTHSASGRRLALEIDGVDPAHRSGWSVVATGPGAALDDEQRDRLRAIRGPDPWVGGQRWLVVGLRWTALTGRAVGPTGATMTY